LSATPEFTEAQLSTARKQAWHQAGEALLTLEDAKAWLSECGLVLFAPQPKAVAVAAPSLVEATLGTENAAPTAAETDTARGFVARLVADGSALPLNLLGGPGDVPDFIVSTQVFPYVFTLRGDKGWKQPPLTSGAVKVSPLALKIYETLAERGAMTAAELASELGRELTEPAILRGLVELWGQLRVIPLLQQGEGVTLWELTTRRFTKAIKTGANAGQPTALSALVSMYLVGVFAATEEEIASFLSPLTARSRVREVLHGLTAGRQLETTVLEGRTLLYIPGALPEFAPEPAAQVAVEGEGAAVPEESVERPAPAEKPEGRIRRFEGQRPAGGQRREFKPREGERQNRAGGARPGNREFRSRSGSTESRQGGAGSGRPAFGSRGGQAPRPAAGGFSDGKPERERRPFNRERSGEDKPSFTRPWQEERGARPQRGPTGAQRGPARPQRGPVGGWKGSPRRAEGEGGGGAPERRPRPESGAPGEWSRKPAGGDRGRAQSDRPQRRNFGPRDGGEGQGAGRPREKGGEGRPFAPRSFERRAGGEGRGSRPAAGGASGRPREARSGGGNGPERRGPSGNGKGAGFEGRGFNRGTDRPAFGDRKPQGSRGPGSRGPGFKSARPSFGGKPGAKSGGKPAFGKRSGPGGGKGSFGPKRNFGPKTGGGSRPDRPTPRKPKPEAEE
jgi:hypothetical protein